jgi:hypothetical protein
MSLICLENLLIRLSRPASCACRLSEWGYLRSSAVLRSIKERGSHWRSGGNLISYRKYFLQETCAKRSSDERQPHQWRASIAAVTRANRTSDESQPQQWREPTASVTSVNRTSDESQPHQWREPTATVTRASHASYKHQPYQGREPTTVTSASHTSDERQPHQWQAPTAPGTRTDSTSNKRQPHQWRALAAPVTSANRTIVTLAIDGPTISKTCWMLGTWFRNPVVDGVLCCDRYRLASGESQNMPNGFCVSQIILRHDGDADAISELPPSKNNHTSAQYNFTALWRR